MKNKLVEIALLAQLLFVSCGSMKISQEKIDVYGMVTSSDDKPVAGYEISLDGKICSVTNTQGLFVIQVPVKKQVVLTGAKEGWECVSLQKKFSNTNELFCMQIKSVEEIILQAETALECADYDRVLCLVESAGASNSCNKKMLIISSIAAYKRKDFTKALRCLEQIDSKDESILFFKQKIIDEQKVVEE